MISQNSTVKKIVYFFGQVSIKVGKIPHVRIDSVYEQLNVFPRRG